MSTYLLALGVVALELDGIHELGLRECRSLGGLHRLSADLLVGARVGQYALRGVEHLSGRLGLLRGSGTEHLPVVSLQRRERVLVCRNDLARSHANVVRLGRRVARRVVDRTDGSCGVENKCQVTQPHKVKQTAIAIVPRMPVLPLSIWRSASMIWDEARLAASVSCATASSSASLPFACLSAESP